MSIANERREARLKQDVSLNAVMSRRTYNLVLGLAVAYGLVINLLLCTEVPHILDDINPLLFLIGYFACAFTGIWLSASSSNPLVSFLGYNMVVVPCGLVLTTSINYYSELDGDIVRQAFLYTACITGVMICASVIKPEFFDGLGTLLFAGLIATLIGSIIGWFIEGVFIVSAWLGALVFSLYIGYDVHRAQEYAPTLDNAIDSAVDIYLDIINLFLKIMQILGHSKSSKD